MWIILFVCRFLDDKCFFIACRGKKFKLHTYFFDYFDYFAIIDFKKGLFIGSKSCWNQLQVIEVACIGKKLGFHTEFDDCLNYWFLFTGIFIGQKSW